MIPAALILDQPRNLDSGGWLAVPKSDAGFAADPLVRVLRVDHVGKIPNWYACLTNADFATERPPRFLGATFLGPGMTNVLALASELGADIYKEKFGKGKRAVVDHVARKPRETAETVGRFFIMLWNRLDQLGLPLFEKGALYETINEALVARLLPLDWKLAHKDLPEALKIGGQVEAWMRRNLPYRSGTRHRVLRRSPFWMADKLIEIPVPYPRWMLFDKVEDSHVIYQGGIASVPQEWSDWWMPGSNAMGSRGRVRERVLWSCAEWNFARDIGCEVVASNGFNCERAVPFREAFPKAFDIYSRLSRRSWIDGWIALKLARLGELPLDRTGTTSPYALWTRGVAMVWQMRWARELQEAAHKQHLGVRIAGFGSNKIHLQHTLSDDEWHQFENLAFTHRCYALPPVPSIAGDDDF